MKGNIYRALLSIFYFVIVVASFSLGLYVVVLNFTEMVQRVQGQTTLFSQMSWLSNRQATWYAAAWFTCFAGLLITQIIFLIRKKFKAALLITICIWLTVLLSIIIDRCFEYNPV